MGLCACYCCLSGDWRLKWRWLYLFLPCIIHELRDGASWSSLSFPITFHQRTICCSQSVLALRCAQHLTGCRGAFENAYSGVWMFHTIMPCCDWHASSCLTFAKGPRGWFPPLVRHGTWDTGSFDVLSPSVSRADKLVTNVANNKCTRIIPVSVSVRMLNKC